MICEKRTVVADCYCFYSDFDCYFGSGRSDRRGRGWNRGSDRRGCVGCRRYDLHRRPPREDSKKTIRHPPSDLFFGCSWGPADRHRHRRRSRLRLRKHPFRHDGGSAAAERRPKTTSTEHPPRPPMVHPSPSAAVTPPPIYCCKSPRPPSSPPMPIWKSWIP